VIAVEVMGRHAGWIALAVGVASGSDVILIPEIPFDMASVCRTIEDRCKRGKRYSIICIAEGAAPRGGSPSVARHIAASHEPVRLGGIAQRITDQIEGATGVESRYVVLGHVQRGGTPVAADRILGTQFGHAALGLLRAGAVNRMVAIRGGRLEDVDQLMVWGRQRTTAPAGPLAAAPRARSSAAAP